jgi:hypothetical protein
MCLALVTAGCIKTNVEPLDDMVRQARSPESVEVLLERPEPPYTVIAVIESETGTVFESFEDLRREMVAEAAKLGGEALILGQETTDEQFILTGTAMIRSDTRKLVGEVIVYDRGG